MRWFLHKRFAVCAAAGSLMGPGVAAGAGPGSGADSPAEHPGAAIFQKHCVECHGPNGEGVEDEYDEPLYGDRSLASLTRLIERTMPEDDEKAVVGKDAAQVAAYIYHAFYSPEARAKLNPPRIALSRLTNRQYRESVADLVGERAKPVGPENGLRAEYFDSEGMDKKKHRKLERVDAAIDFDFGAGAPVAEMNAEQFSIAWDGSLRARETGFYEFRVRTPNGARLYVNAALKEGDRNYRDDSSDESQKPLIDAWVSSGDEVREETARIFLLGGRVYPFRLDYFKYKEKAGSVRLEWKPPHGAWTVPAGPDFAPHSSRRTMVVATPFPADDRSLGYERGTSVSREWFEAVTMAAVDVADEIDERLEELSGVNRDSREKDKRLKQFAASFAERAFRRPLTEEERARHVEAMFSGAESPELAVKRVVLFVLKSPHFLYPDAPGDGAPEAHRTAARLALYLWDSLPDGDLLAAAREGRLGNRDQIAAQARRMLEDPRARAKMRGFFHHWLEMDGERDLLKDAKAYPGFDERTIADLRHSLNLFVDGITWSERSDYRELLLADSLPLNGSLAALYGKTIDAGGDAGGDGEAFVRVAFDPKERAGVLTHPYLLSAFAYPDNSSPIHRGVFLTRHIVGRPLKPPPVAVAFKDAEFDPALTMREKVTELTRDAACMSCHSSINPLGFSLENFDAIGRWRTEENDKPVDASSKYKTEDGRTIQLRGARDIAEFAAGNEAAHRAFVMHLFDHLVKQPAAAYGEGTLENLRGAFSGSGFSIRNLVVEIASVAAMPQPVNKDS